MATHKKVHSVQVMGKNKNKTHHFTGKMKQGKKHHEWLRLTVTNLYTQQTITIIFNKFECEAEQTHLYTQDYESGYTLE
jgi:hypothetical protein